MPAQVFGPVEAFQFTSEVAGLSWARRLARANAQILDAVWFVDEGGGVSFSNDAIDLDVTKARVTFAQPGHVRFGVRVELTDGDVGIALIHAYVKPVQGINAA